MTPFVTSGPAPAWRAAEVRRPKVAESAGAELVGWNAISDDRASLVTGCVATPIPGWVEDMRPAIEARSVALAGAVTEGITGVPMDARPVPLSAPPTEGGGFASLALRAASDLGGPVLGDAQAFLGWDGDRVFTCFATCAVRTSAGADARRPLGCEQAVREAHLEGSLPPPRPGIGLSAVTWAVHHPRPAALYGGVFVVAASVLFIAFRRRPRSAIHR